MSSLSDIPDRNLKQVLAELKIEIDGIVGYTKKYSARKFENYQDKINKYFLFFLERQGDNVFKSAKTFDIDENSVKNLFELVKQRSYNLLEQQVNRAFAEAKFTIERIIEKKKVPGLFGIFGLSKLIGQKVQVKSVPGFSRLNKQGKIYKINLVSYLLMLIDTAIEDFERQVNKQIALTSRVDLMRVSPQPCWLGPQVDEVCNRWRDKIVSITGTTEGFPQLQDALREKPPLFHPNCRHKLIPLTKDEQKKAIQVKAKTYTQLKKSGG